MIAAYLRVSSYSQTEASQKHAVQQWLDGHDIKDVRWYVDRDRSGDDLDREGMDELQADIFAGTIKTVVVYKLDRISRKLRDGINLLCEWLEQGVRLVSVTQQLDFSGVTGKLVASVLFAVAEMEQETRRERQAHGIAVAKKLGKYKGGRPGYRKAKPATAYKLHLLGMSQVEIAKYLGITPRSVQRYIRERQKSTA